jgi:putative SOS response-associated peptidase YedK
MTLATPDWRAIARLLGADAEAADGDDWRPRFNVAPSQPHPIVRAEGGHKTLARAAWGFHSRAGRPLINVRAETLGQRSRFAAALLERRCVVPADGYFEWQGGQPYWFHAPERSLMTFAGLWEPSPDGARFVVVTTAPNAEAAAVHDRMPAILPPACVAEWLARPALELLVPAPAGSLRATPVSPRVGATANDDAELLAEVRPRGQLSLL